MHPTAWNPAALDLLLGAGAGFVLWFFLRIVAAGIYTIGQNERAVLTRFGRAERIPGRTTLDDPVAAHLSEQERSRYFYPQVRVIQPGGPYLKMPWETVHKVNVATTTVNMALDPEDAYANNGGTRLDAVTKDHLNTGLTGQIRYRVSEQNLYAFLFGIKRPLVHVMGYFVSVLRQRIANFEARPLPPGAAPPAVPGAEVTGVSINDLRKNLRDLNEYMERECRSAPARYGVVLDASLITGIDPPPEVESALAAINTAYNQVSSEISLAQAAAGQKIEQSKRAVEIETLRAQAEVQPLRLLAAQLADLHRAGPGVLAAYLRNVRLRLFEKVRAVYVEAGK
jgi:regulator of protease activity HflC (stomatin/prohibitin superfamily)